MRLPRRCLRAGGFTYLGMLFLVALTSAGLAALGQAWGTAAQREKERELAWRGAEIARAIVSYATAGNASLGEYPRSLEDLLVDRRGLKPRHHLRRAYVDPFTLQVDWVLVPETTQPGRFSAVHSRSDQLLLKQLQPDGSIARKASERLFAASTYAEGAPPLPAVAASGAASSASRLR
jgi:type II secretory pathway pseudopilin PulG